MQIIDYIEKFELIEYPHPKMKFQGIEFQKHIWDITYWPNPKLEEYQGYYQFYGTYSGTNLLLHCTNEWECPFLIYTLSKLDSEKLQRRLIEVSSSHINENGKHRPPWILSTGGRECLLYSIWW